MLYSRISTARMFRPLIRPVKADSGLCLRRAYSSVVPLRRVPLTTGSCYQNMLLSTRQNIDSGLLSSFRVYSSSVSSSASKYKPADLHPETLSTDEYHEIADLTIDNIVEQLEELAETNPSYDVEYSSGVMTVIAPQGTYIINKQPPNKQIWLSSPISGPKRYDWLESSNNESVREWVYSRDGSTLRALLKEEIGIEYDHSERDD